MAESVRELVVTLSLDAGTFSKTCKDINDQIKGVQSQFNAITGGVDSWQSTIEGRNAKLTALNETLALQQEKIKAIADELATATGKLMAAETPGDTLKAARKKSELETKLYDAQTQAEKTKLEIEKINQIKFDEFGKKMKTFGDSLQTFGRKFSMYIGGPLAALGVKSFNLAQEYETAMTRLQIASQATDDEIAILNDTILRMSGEIPFTYVEIADMMKTLSEAGVPISNLEKIAQQFLALKSISDIDDDGITNMIRFMEIMKIPLDNIDQFSSALFSLGINSVATSSEIFEMANRMASTGALAGFSAQEILALATAYTSLGINAEAGGTASNKLMKEFQLAAETGNGAKASLEQLAGVMGITEEKFVNMQKTDPAGLMLNFFDSLTKGGAEGNSSVLALLDSLGITEARLSALAATAANNPDFFSEMLAYAEQAWSDTSAAADAADKAFSTSAANTKTSLNEMENAAADVGENVIDAVQPIIDVIADLATEFGKLDEATQTNWVKVAGALVLLGPAAMGIGSVASAVGSMSKWIATLTPANIASWTSFTGSMMGMLGVAAGSIGAIYALIELMKASYNSLDGALKTDITGLTAVVEEIKQSGTASDEATGKMDGYLAKLKELDGATFNPVSTSTDTAAKTALWAPIFTEGVRDEMFGGLSVESIVGEGSNLAYYIEQYRAKLEADLKAATSEASSAGIGTGTTEGLTAATPTAETAASGLATAVDNAFTGELGIESPSTVFIQHGLDTAMGMNIGLLQGLPVVVGAMTTLGAALTAIAAAQGTAAGAAYGAAFSSAASIQLNASMAKIKRELDSMNIRINRGYGST